MVSGFAKKNTKAIKWIKANIGNKACSTPCRVCHALDESAMHIASGYTQLAKRRYEFRHDIIDTRIDYNIKVCQNWYG